MSNKFNIVSHSEHQAMTWLYALINSLSSNNKSYIHTHAHAHKHTQPQTNYSVRMVKQVPSAHLRATLLWTNLHKVLSECGPPDVRFWSWCPWLRWVCYSFSTFCLLNESTVYLSTVGLSRCLQPVWSTVVLSHLWVRTPLISLWGCRIAWHIYMRAFRDIYSQLPNGVHVGG